MKIYFACPTGQRRNEIVANYGNRFGACLTRDVFNNITANMMPWFLDNGAFSDWKNGINDLTNQKFLTRLERVANSVENGHIPMPDFVVIPDIVNTGTQSLLHSRRWLHLFKDNFPQFKFYLAAQNNMRFFYNEDYQKSTYCIEVSLFSGLYDGLFVGGTKEWKYKNGVQLVELAHKYNVPCHIGGIGNRKSILWAKMVGADSCDSGVAMIHPKHLKEIFALDSELLWNVA